MIESAQQTRSRTRIKTRLNSKYFCGAVFLGERNTRRRSEHYQDDDHLVVREKHHEGNLNFRYLDLVPQLSQISELSDNREAKNRDWDMIEVRSKKGAHYRRQILQLKGSVYSRMEEDYLRTKQMIKSSNW